MKRHAFGILWICCVLSISIGCASSRVEVVQPREYQSLGYGVYQVFANPSRGFQYDYLIWVPSLFSEQSIHRLLVTTANTGQNDDMSYHLWRAKSQINSGYEARVAQWLGVPTMIAVFPRPRKIAHIYTHTLDRETLMISSGQMKRLDRQLISMIADAKEFLQEQFAIQVKDKVFMHGFSGNGIFALRFSTLYPDLVKAVAAGGIGGIPILPVATLDGHPLVYPVGVGDISSFTGSDFNRAAYNQVSKFVYMGDLDTNDAFGGIRPDSEIAQMVKELIWEAVGKDMKKRWEKSRAVLEEHAENIQVITYLDLGHEHNVKDMVNFLKANDAEGFHEIQPTGRWR